jgi:ATP-dependent helicase HrpB
LKILPIDAVVGQLKEVLSTHANVVLIAPPGAGKSTRVPLALLDEIWLAGRRILMLEPRRLAARNSASYMSIALSERVGGTVGYRVRLDSKVSKHTRIEVITEGILTRMLQDDPSLDGVGLVIFDEYHERSVHADLGLALCLQAQSIFREDLKILIMSATLDAKSVASMMNEAPIIESEGIRYPIETHYLSKPTKESIDVTVSRTVLQALNEHTGDIIVFLPGIGEIRRVSSKLRAMNLGEHVRITPLHSSLTQEEQDLAISPSSPGIRKVVLSSAIAETSITVEGVHIVIDSGWMRVPRFSPRTGLTGLETVLVSQASADQRRGRAGRTAPGICYRLWTEQEGTQLPLFNVPEIMEADLTPLALELAAWGVIDPSELHWLDPPPQAAYRQARDILAQLGALTPQGLISDHGKRMNELGIHPRLAHMLIKSTQLGLESLAFELIVMLNERDLVIRQSGNPDIDIMSRLEAIRNDRSLAGRIRMELQYWERLMKIKGNTAVSDLSDCGLLLAFAYPDRIAQRRASGGFLLRNGRGAGIKGLQRLSNVPYIVAIELDDQGAESRIYGAATIELRTLEQHMSEQLEELTTISWDRSVQAVRARRQTRLGSLILKEHTHSELNPEAGIQPLLEGIAIEGLQILPWSKSSRQYQQRVSFIHQHDSNWPDLSDEVLLSSVKDWLGPHLLGMKNRADLQRVPLTQLLESMLTWNQRQQLEKLFPTHIVVPSGSRIPIDYKDAEAPSIAVRLQEIFGLRETPCIALGNIPLTLHLLSPAQRPVQITRDLESFWQTAYYDIKKDLKGRYPKHYWPDDPLVAMPTNRTKPRGT